MPNIAIVGATGAVGQELLKILAERDFPIEELRLLASKKSGGRVISWQGRKIEVQETTHASFKGIDIALFAGGSASTQYASSAVKEGAVVIDNSSAFRLNPDVPLIVPEVNPEDIKRHKGIIANPNCSTIIMVVVLKPFEQVTRIKRVVVSTYQAVSGAGKEGIAELENQLRSWSKGESVGSTETFPYQIAFNLIPRIDIFEEADYTKEEWKMVRETQKILNRNDIGITATCVRVPVLRSHCEALNIETEEKLTVQQVKDILSAAPGIKVLDDPAEDRYPMPLDSSDKDDVYVGRIREDLTIANGLNLWIAGDQIRKGAATNAVQIAELLL